MHKSKTREDIVSLIKQLKELGCSHDYLRRADHQEKIKCSNGQDYECIHISEHTTVGILKHVLETLPEDATVYISPYEDDYADVHHVMTFQHVVPDSDHRWKYLLTVILEGLTGTVQICYNGANKTVPRDIAIQIQLLLEQAMA